MIDRYFCSGCINFCSGCVNDRNRFNHKYLKKMKGNMPDNEFLTISREIRIKVFILCSFSVPCCLTSFYRLENPEKLALRNGIR